MGGFCCNGKRKPETDIDKAPFLKDGNTQHHITENLILTRQQDVREVYEIVSLIGKGSISNIYKIRRRRKAIGRTAESNTLEGEHAPSLIADHNGIDMASPKPDEASEPVVYYALKEINLQVVNPEFLDEMKNECELLRDLSHPHIIKVFAVFFYDMLEQDRGPTPMIGIVLELCGGGDLSSRIPYTERQAGRILFQLIQAVQYLHSRNIIHRDIKFGNIMFESKQPNAEIKLIDFGLSRKFLKHELVKGTVGTVYTMSPQVLQGYYTSQSDMWSVGVVAFELLSGEKPFWGNSMSEIANKVIQGEYHFDGPVWMAVSKEAKHFCTQLLQYSPLLRYTSQGALNDPWLRRFQTPRHVDASTMHDVLSGMASFSKKSEFERLAWQVIARKATTDEIFEMRQVFEQVVNEHRQDHPRDSDGQDPCSNQISYSDFCQVMSRVLGMKEDEIEDIFRHVDVNQTGSINYTEFLAATLAVKGRIQEQHIAEAFDLLDVDGSGYITRDDLQNILGKEATPGYIEQIMAELDEDQDGKVGYVEFKKAFEKTHMHHVQKMGTFRNETANNDEMAPN